MATIRAAIGRLTVGRSATVAPGARARNGSAVAAHRPRAGWLEISGEAGIGKSRLIDELTSLADQRGHLVLRGHGSELERDIPFNAIVDALDDYLGAVDPDRLCTLGADRLDELASVFPALRPLGRARTDTSELDRWQTYRAVRRLLELLAAEHPLVLALDDLHWADTASAELVAHLLRRPPAAAVLLVLSYRPRQAPATLLAALEAASGISPEQAADAVAGADAATGASGGSGATGTRIRLGALSRTDADLLLSLVRDPVAKDRWYRQSGGNPFYLEQLARSRSLPPSTTAANGAAVAVATGVTDDALDDLEDKVPPAVAAAVGAEIAALPFPVRLFAQGAAVAGDTFDPDLAAAAAGAPSTSTGGAASTPTGAPTPTAQPTGPLVTVKISVDIDEIAVSPLDAVDVLIRADVIRPTELPGRFAFRHPIVRHAVYVSAGPGWRLGAHARAAAALAARGAPATARAHHVERSAVPGDEEAVALLAAAADASRLRAPAAAARWYDAALRLLPAVVGEIHPRRIALLARLASALDSSYQPERARDVLDEILGLIPSSLPEERAHVIALRSAVDHMLGRHGEARALVLDALATADPATREGCLLRLQLVIDHFYTGEYDGMRRWQREAHPLAERLGDRALLAVSTGLLAGAEYMASGVAAADAGATEAARRYDLLADDEVLPHLAMLAWLGWTEMYLERFTAAARHLDRADSLARRRGRGVTLAMAAVGRATLAGWRGQIPEAARLAEEAVESCLLAPHLPFLSWALAVRCWTATLDGDLTEALRLGAHAVQVAHPDTDAVSVLAGSHYAEALVEAGQPDRAIDELFAAAGGPDLPRVEEAYRPYWYELLTRAELARRDLDRAGQRRPGPAPIRPPNLARPSEVVRPSSGAGAAGALAGNGAGDAETVDGVAAAERWARRAEYAAAHAGGGLPGRAASALRARAAVELARGDAVAAAKAALASAAAAERAGLPIESGRSLTLAGRALTAVGDTTTAVSELRRAESRLRAAGARRPGDEAARLLRQLGEKVARGGRPAGSWRPAARQVGGLGGGDGLGVGGGAPGGGALAGIGAAADGGAQAGARNSEMSGATAARLSARERQIAELVAAGQTNRQIAAELFVSEKTVESHVTKVLAKLGVPSRAAVGAVLRS
ncbi:helix-turn-helix transcriptional regulator [Pseudofrankia saprophytica]|uniref:helix-turn-helix transcriptional regulator n=1 Tax=Pseudofrankia saprophytica TaxID=298655 RepID=UPI000A03ABB7|nr:LuxR family transcriptional regulator [Pseudofrankia saprophytica]